MGKLAYRLTHAEQRGKFMTNVGLFHKNYRRKHQSELSGMALFDSFPKIIRDALNATATRHTSLGRVHDMIKRGLKHETIVRKIEERDDQVWAGLYERIGWTPNRELTLEDLL